MTYTYYVASIKLMAINIHTDPTFEKYLNWLSDHTNKTKTDLIKELVLERYRLKRAGFQFGALRTAKTVSSRKIQNTLKKLDKDRDLG